MLYAIIVSACIANGPCTIRVLDFDLSAGDCRELLPVIRIFEPDAYCTVELEV